MSLKKKKKKKKPRRRTNLEAERFCYGSLKLPFLWRKKNESNFSWRRRRLIHEGKEGIVKKIQTFVKK